MIKKYLAKGTSETKRLGQKLAQKILSASIKKRTFVVALEGDLGGGKTTFLQGFAKGLGIRQKILSPTFVIMRKFRIKNSKFAHFYHFDCYRVNAPKEILDIGFRKIVAGPGNIVAIEWADRIKRIIPKEAIFIDFEFVDKNKRRIVIKSRL